MCACERVGRDYCVAYNGTAVHLLLVQAGAKPTTDFGACRDLQGRRLRHVNDEVRLQKWQEDR